MVMLAAAIQPARQPKPSPGVLRGFTTSQTGSTVGGGRDTRSKRASEATALSNGPLDAFGQFLGHVVGGFFLNGAIFQKGTRLGGLKKPAKKKQKPKLQKLKENAISKFVSTEFGHGMGMPIIKLVLSRYLLLFQRLCAQSEDLWQKIEADVKKPLYGTAQHQIFLDQGRQPVTIEKAKTLLSMFDTLLIGYLDELLKTPDLDKKLAAVAKYLETAKAPSWDDLLEGRAPDKFSKEAMTFAAIGHLHSALDELAEMLRFIMDPVRTVKGHEVSILDTLNILGITTSEEEAQEALSKQLVPVFGSDEQRQAVAKASPCWNSLCLLKTLSAAKKKLEFLPDGVKSHFNVRVRQTRYRISKHRSPRLADQFLRPTGANWRLDNLAVSQCGDWFALD